MDLIDSRQLRAFQLLARSGSFTLAAKQMFVTQSAISHAIKALESSLDCRLLDRSGKKIALTTEGEALLHRADKIIDEMHGATEELKALSRWGYGKLRVGATDTMCQYLLPSVLREFRECFPNCAVSIRADDTQDLIASLERGDIDLALGIHQGSDEAGTDFRPLFEDQLVFAVPPAHPWAANGRAPRENLAEQLYIIYARLSPTYNLVERHFRKLGIRSLRLTELGNMEAIKELAKINMGVGVIAPWVIRDELSSGTLVGVQPPGDPMRREWGLFVRGHGRELPVTWEKFAQICGTVSRDLANS